MQYRLTRCDFNDGRTSTPCSFTAMYRVTVFSAEGPTCELLLCDEHVSESWNVGQKVLRIHFPDLKLSLGYVRLDPVQHIRAAGLGAD